MRFRRIGFIRHLDTRRGGSRQPAATVDRSQVQR
jgi:hypothetical protein